MASLAKEGARSRATLLIEGKEQTMSTQPKYIAVLNPESTKRLYKRRGIVQPQSLSDEAIRQLAKWSVA
jgi:hypothetical protein